MKIDFKKALDEFIDSYDFASEITHRETLVDLMAFHRMRAYVFGSLVIQYDYDKWKEINELMYKVLDEFRADQEFKRAIEEVEKECRKDEVE